MHILDKVFLRKNVDCMVKKLTSAQSFLFMLFKSTPLGTDYYFLSGGGGGTIFGTCRQFFLKSNAFHVMKTIFYDHLKKCYRLFYRSYLEKTLLVHAYTLKSHLNETNSP